MQEIPDCRQFLSRKSLQYTDSGMGCTVTAVPLLSLPPCEGREMSINLMAE